ncbi:MAG: hypothetical protein H0T51_11300 [Pirellulales bacterium]|nr:hypothetical protein [Pirellulales bacterium]
MPRRRFRLRTLLIVTAAIVLTAGAMRWWYDSQLAEFARQKRVVAELGKSHVTVAWEFLGPKRMEHSRLDRVFRRPTNVWFEYITDGELAKTAPRLAELTNLTTAYLLGSQIVPLAREVQAGETNGVIEALRAHPTLRTLVVDASIRGTPAEFDAPIYSRDDLALLEEVLPNLKIEWIEVN